MNGIAAKTPYDISRDISRNVRNLRKARKISLKRLSEISGVSYGSLKRFESTGEIALKSLLKVAVVLDCTDTFTELFSVNKPQTLQDIIDGKA